MLLVQDMAFVPLLALAGALASGSRTDFSTGAVVAGRAGGAAAVAAVLAAGRWLLRPLFHEIAHSRLRELFTLAVLLVVLASAWVSHLAGLSLALGAFLAGMMLAETEYRHQIESVIRPFSRHSARALLHHVRHALGSGPVGARVSLDLGAAHRLLADQGDSCGARDAAL